MINPFSRVDTVEGASRAARSSSLALWLSAARYGVAVAAMLANYSVVKSEAAEKLAAMGKISSADTGTMAMSMVAGVAVFAVIEMAAGIWQWRRPGVVIPIIWSLVIGFSLYLAAKSGLGPSTMIGVLMLLLCLALHLAGLRGALALEKLRNPRPVLP